MPDVCKVCSIYVQDVCKMCAKCVQDVCKVLSICVQGVRKMFAYVLFDIIEPRAFRKYSTCWVLEKSVHACVVNVIRAKVLPGSVLYIEH